MMKRIIIIFLFMFLSTSLVGCVSNKTVRKLGKSDINMVADSHLHEVEKLLKELTAKLYRRNPQELSKSSGFSLDERLGQLFAADRRLVFTEVERKHGIAEILLALDIDYKGDRVFALTVGLTSMIRHSYGNQREFFLFDNLNPQHLHNSARNIEVLVWRLKTRTDEHGVPLILTNNLPDEERNLSFERLFGKLISLQDMMATIASQKWDRAFNFIVHSAASATFLPVGL